MRSPRIIFGVSCVAAVAALSALGCTDSADPPDIRSLERSGELVFVCGVSDVSEGDGTANDGVGPPTGVPLSECQTQVLRFTEDGKTKTRRLYALVTQTVRGEVAVLDRAVDDVVNTDPQVPGESFLPIGGQPQGIAATPGSRATFVAVAEPGKEGIFAIPTTDILAPEVGQPPRDITNWPACSLEFPPGEVTVVLDPPKNGLVRASCLAPHDAYDQPDDWEAGPPGRRKLAVTIPSKGVVALIDAENVASRDPGTYQPCVIDRWIVLGVNLPGTPVPQELPPDLVAEPGCLPDGIAEGPTLDDAYEPLPSGMALAQGPLTTNLYLGDSNAPVIHNLDMTDPCAPVELPPLLPRSFDNPKRVVTSTEIAVSPLFPKWLPQTAADPELDQDPAESQRFLYAVDDRKGSLMIFDVSDPTSTRTPLVRPNSQWMPFEPPDRIAFSSPVKSLTFALAGVPGPTNRFPNPDIGILCAPSLKAAEDEALGSNYAPNFPELDEGASPGLLRGVFAFAALADGKIAVVDVGDFDATCRLPAVPNLTTTVDFRGCTPLPGPASNATLYENSTHEASCNVVEPHRARSAAFIETTTGTGVHAASLATFPVFQPSNAQSTEFDSTASPQLLAIDFNDEGLRAPAEVRVGTTLYINRDFEAEGTLAPLVIQPNAEEVARSSLSLIMREPRAYPPEESYSVAFEGAIASERPAGSIARTGVDSEAFIKDSTVSFCGMGVQDKALAELEAVRLAGGVDPTEFSKELFAVRSSDYVQITQALAPAGDSSYGDESSCNYDFCNDAFGDVLEDSETPNENFTPFREFRVIKAWANGLRVTPRSPADVEPSVVIDAAINCCFGGTFSYVVRGSNQWIVRGSRRAFQHHTKTGPAPPFDPAPDPDPETQFGGRCELSCDPLRQEDNGRVYEVSCLEEPEPGKSSECGNVGYDPAATQDATTNPVACQFSKDVIGSKNNPGSAIPFTSPCAFQSSTQRFAVYRGSEPVPPDSFFGFTVTGGFLPLSRDLAATDTRVLPQTIQFNAELQQLVITDAQSQGVVFLNVNNLGLVDSVF